MNLIVGAVYDRPHFFCSNGRIQDIAGSYLAFAWEDVEDGLWRDPEFIRRNEATGKPVQIDERSRGSVELPAVPFSF